MLELCIEWETFNFRVWVGIGPHKHLPSLVRRKHRRVYRERASKDLQGLYFRSKPGCGGIIWLPRIPRSPDDIGYLTHEVGHAVMDMHTQRSLNLDSANDETFCYAIAHGVSAILKGCRK